MAQVGTEENISHQGTIVEEATSESLSEKENEQGAYEQEEAEEDSHQHTHEGGHAHEHTAEEVKLGVKLFFFFSDRFLALCREQPDKAKRRRNLEKLCRNWV
ncbi:hypothetical protein GAYE_PCTG14G0653 [Galdieria yellowstonensis]|uniref:Uncharacterized protein n=1 Tax=Galdieria yellowstonensis TaxID=3028027 RepID=A0AAV9I5T9_9RHOD|nr:hypothetical protein GAYE_PCTG14G0653 [Galdieria yellowstonensis]